MCFIRTEELVFQQFLDRALTTLRKRLANENDPLWPYAVILEEVISCQHLAVYCVRDLVIYEEGLQTSRRRPQADYPRLHGVFKHTSTLVEILEVNSRNLDGIIECHKPLVEDSTLGITEVAPRRLLHQRFLFQSQMIFGIRIRCASYKERIRNEIQLAFNLVAEEEARNSVDIAASSKADSHAMAAMGIITLLFLPPTFISAIFSTTFFDFGDDRHSWSVSDKFYVYWAATVPITIIVGVILYRGFLHHPASTLRVRQLVVRLNPIGMRRPPSDTSSGLLEKPGQDRQ